MITNATIDAIAPEPELTGDGGRSEAEAVFMSVRCFVDSPRIGRDTAKASFISEAQAALFVPGLSLQTQLVEGARVTFTMDGCTARTLQVIWSMPRVKAGGLSHVEALLKTV